MQVLFSTRKMRRDCSTEREMVRRWGKPLAKKLQQRLMELYGAPTLADMSRLPPARCHELALNRKGQLSIDLVHPYRLVFVPDHDPVPLKPDRGLDWALVTKVLVLEVADTHA